jgi:hypothetical protein
MKSNTALTNVTNIMLPYEGIQFVSSSVAKNWLDNFNYAFQRNIRSYHVASLANEIVQGRFREKTQINFCSFGDSFHLVNGQHTLSAIVTANAPVLLSVIVTECKNEQEVADQFARHDTHLTRQVADALFAHQVHEEFGVTKTQLQLMTAGCLYFAFMKGQMNVKAANQISNDTKLSLVREHGGLAKDALMMVNGTTYGQASFMTRKTSLASMMVTIQGDVDISKSFWTAIALDDGLKQGDPRKTLLKLFNETITPGGRSFTAKKTIPDHMIVKSCACAWNSFYDRKNLSLIRADFQSKEVSFKGCGTYRV